MEKTKVASKLFFTYLLIIIGKVERKQKNRILFKDIQIQKFIQTLPYLRTFDLRTFGATNRAVHRSKVFAQKCYKLDFVLSSASFRR